MNLNSLLFLFNLFNLTTISSYLSELHSSSGKSTHCPPGSEKSSGIFWFQTGLESQLLKCDGKFILWLFLLVETSRKLVTLETPESN